jgi:Flp pilus assembly protein TadB
MHKETSMNGIYIPIIGVLSIAAMFITFSILNSRNQTEVQRTLRIALERGVPLSAELVSQMNTNRPSKRTDMRRGIIIASIGIGALVAGIITGLMKEFATVAVFPIFMGLGFLLVWKLESADAVA